jgi:hypothetical protein
MFLQQSCLWLDGLQGIVRQHFMDRWSRDMAWHSANCISSITLSATTKDVILRNIIRVPGEASFSILGFIGGMGQRNFPMGCHTKLTRSSMKK